MNLVECARCFAIAAHESIQQRRKYTGEPYWYRSQRVAELVESVNGTQEQIAAAWLHDVVEDTGVTIEVIRDMFGETVAEYVDDLTNVSKPSDGDRATRKNIDKEHTATASPEAKTIKLADVIDNTNDIVSHDLKFAKVYLKEKLALLEVLKEGNEELYKQAEEVANADIKNLGL